MKKLRNCRTCEHNPMGVCELTGKEVPTSYVIGFNKGLPRFCPFKKEKKNGSKTAR